ncbi:hypothetical protein B296_00012389 [Ensete ventricosum]|uniref:Uncharacterized protein n=1 Tax=Ensete ventricosum TaxID=4639 RepID=A0A426ZTH0_ENSVE|nr:hypothetical protein B296_00012389 [Ensete ventricosum]
MFVTLGNYKYHATLLLPRLHQLHRAIDGPPRQGSDSFPQAATGGPACWHRLEVPVVNQTYSMSDDGSQRHYCHRDEQKQAKTKKQTPKGTGLQTRRATTMAVKEGIGSSPDRCHILTRNSAILGCRAPFAMDDTLWISRGTLIDYDMQTTSIVDEEAVGSRV